MDGTGQGSHMRMANAHARSRAGELEVDAARRSLQDSPAHD